MSLASRLYTICVNNNISIATAESCTSGLISSTICSVSGASSFFKGGLIAYQDQVKINQLNISKSLIEKKTSVSLDVAKKMAKNSLDIFNADYAIATTGYTGPTGGNDKDPIGTVFIAVANEFDTIVKHFVFDGNREIITKKIVDTALELLIMEIKKNE